METLEEEEIQISEKDRSAESLESYWSWYWTDIAEPSRKTKCFQDLSQNKTTKSKKTLHRNMHADYAHCSDSVHFLPLPALSKCHQSFCMLFYEEILRSPGTVDEMAMGSEGHP